MPSLGPPELIVILVLVIIVFGVGKLPEVGKQKGPSKLLGPRGTAYGIRTRDLRLERAVS